MELRTQVSELPANADPSRAWGRGLVEFRVQTSEQDTSRETGYGSPGEAQDQNQLLPLGGGLVLA